jgi:peptide/nickel transport system permease protein
LFFVFFCIYAIIYKTEGSTVIDFKSKTLGQTRIVKVNSEKNNIVVSYLKWLKNAIVLDFGKSLVTGNNVFSQIKPLLFNSFLLNLFALAITLLFGVASGVISALMPSKFGKLSELPLYFLFAIPDFLLAVILLSVFSFSLHIFPSYGLKSLNFENLTAVGKLMDIVKHLLLPAITLSGASLVFISRFTSNTLAETKNAMFIKAMKSRGVASRYILKAIFKNTLYPFISLISILIPSLIGGAVIVETIFSYPGIGKLFYKAILMRDYPVILAIAFVNTVFVFLGMIVSNMLYKQLDTRRMV